MRFLLATLALFALFALIAWRVYRPASRDRYEEAKHRMLEPDGIPNHDRQEKNG